MASRREETVEANDFLQGGGGRDGLMASRREEIVGKKIRWRRGDEVFKNFISGKYSR